MLRRLFRGPFAARWRSGGCQVRRRGRDAWLPRAGVMAPELLEDRRLLASIHGQKWHDANGNALHDPGEQGLSGWTIELRDPQRNLVSTAVTADRDVDRDGQINPVTESGLYTFEGVPEGTYALSEVVRAGWIQSTVDPVVRLVSELDDELRLYKVNCGFEGWHGANEKWVRAGDHTGQWYYILPNGELYRWDNVSGSRLGSPLHGTLVAVLDPIYHTYVDLLHMAPVPTSTVMTLEATTEARGVDFGNYQSASLGGRKWYDLNADGAWDAHEPAINSWPIELVDGEGQVVARTITVDADLNADGRIDPQTESGWFRFDDLKIGSYTLREGLREGWLPSGPLAAEQRIMLADGARIVDAHFGNYRPASVTGRKWHDMDADGDWDAGEPALNGWTIELLDAAGQVVATAVTADNDRDGDGQIEPSEESGWYRFQQLKPGAYHLREVQQAGWVSRSPSLVPLELGMPGDRIAGKAYTVADRFIEGFGGIGTHLHASNEQPVDPIGSTIFAADMAEVGGLFGDEEIRGIVEINLAAMPLAERVAIAFQVADLSELTGFGIGGLLGQPPYEGTIDVVAFRGNGAEGLEDFQSAPIGVLGSVSTVGLAAGDAIRLDVTDIYNPLLAAAEPWLGIRLQISSSLTIPDGAITLESFELVTTETVRVVEASWLVRMEPWEIRADFGNHREAAGLDGPR